jgi:dipeptidyl aminopeptidase/acylaminoacyl peptidase
MSLSRSPRLWSLGSVFAVALPVFGAGGDPLPAGAAVRLGTPGQPVAHLTFSPDGKTLAAGSADGTTIRLWDVAAGKELRRLTGSGYGPIAFSPDGKTLAVGSGRVVRLCDAATGKEVRQLRGHLARVLFVAFAADGRSLTSFSRGSDRDPWLGGAAEPGEATVRVWDVATGKALQARRTLPLAGKVVRDRSEDRVADGPSETSFAFTPEGGRAVTVRLEDGFWYFGDLKVDYVGGRQVLRLTDTATGRLRLVVERPPKTEAHAVLLAPDGRGLALLLTGPPAVCLLEAATGKERLRIPAPPHGVTAAAFSPGGARIAVAGLERGKDDEASLRLTDTATGKDRARFRPGPGRIGALAFSPDSRYLASAGPGPILVWDLKAIKSTPKRAELSVKETDALWADLADADAGRAYRALAALTAAPAPAVRLLRERVRPMTPDDVRRVRLLIADLDSGRFAVRQRAADELEKVGEAAGPALRAALVGKPSLEKRRQIERLLEQFDRAVPPPEPLRRLRAIEVLERIGTADAERVLQTLAEGVVEDPLVGEAKASLSRLARRRP